MSLPNDLELYKYPRTHHLEGSRLQPGDHDLSQVSFADVAGRYLVAEEKMDGANSAMSFTADGQLMLQSRGHYLTGGGRERHFALFKTWAYTHMTSFWRALSDRYIMYGEWLYAKHTVFYNHLPHYFMEFDVLDKQTGDFLSTARRRELLAGLPVVPVKVLSEGVVESLSDLTDLIGHSHFIRGDHMADLRRLCSELGLDTDRAITETDNSEIMEGLYIKVEEEGVVKDRLKYVRADFLMTMLASDSHWHSRPIIPNQLAPDVDIFAMEGWGYA